MRVRVLDATGDMTFGRGAANFYVNTPSGVGQCIMTRLKLIVGEWFLDTTAGTDWGGKILGRQTANSYDAEIKRVILGTQGVTSLVAYSSALSAGRGLTINAQVLTKYSQAQAITIAQTLSIRAAISA